MAVANSAADHAVSSADLNDGASVQIGTSHANLAMPNADCCVDVCLGSTFETCFVAALEVLAASAVEKVSD